MTTTDDLDYTVDDRTAADLAVCHAYLDELAPHLHLRHEVEDYTARILAVLRKTAARTPQVTWVRVMDNATFEYWMSVGEDPACDLINATHGALDVYPGDSAWWALIDSAVRL